MEIFKYEYLIKCGTNLFNRIGTCEVHSQIISEVLVRSSFCGHDSHGLQRFTEYKKLFEDKKISANGKITKKIVDNRMFVNGGNNWGIVVANEVINELIDLSNKHSICSALIKNCNHIGRLGEYISKPAMQKKICLAFVNSYDSNRKKVVPWLGVEGKLTPTPIGFGCPSGYKWPLMIDITTSAMPEGKIRDYMFNNKRLPEKCIVDKYGKFTNDPNKLYDDSNGAILPLGGIFGHKGYALTILIEILAGGLTSSGYVNEKNNKQGNGVFFIIIDIEKFINYEEFIYRTKSFIKYIKKTKTRENDKVLLPGEPEHNLFMQNKKNGIKISKRVLNNLEEVNFFI